MSTQGADGTPVFIGIPVIGAALARSIAKVERLNAIRLPRRFLFEGKRNPFIEICTWHIRRNQEDNHLSPDTPLSLNLGKSSQEKSVLIRLISDVSVG